MKFKLTLFLILFINLLAQAQNGIIKGKVLNALNNEPVAYASVFLIGTDKGVNTDDNGDYEFTGLTPRLYDVRVTYVGFKEETAFEIQVSNSKPAIIDIKLTENTNKLDEVVIKASPFKKTEESPVSLRTIGVAEIQRNPGGNRDISRVIQSLPGVTSSASFRNDLIIRGGAPNENRFYLDDVEVPNINHFATQGASGGPVGLINVDFIREVDFYSGAFPANRSNALSSVFNFRQRDSRDDRLGFTATLGASDFGVTLEGPLSKSKKTTFLLSTRRSYLQFLFKAIGLPFLPTYNDFQAKVKHKINDKNEIYFIGLGAIDQFTLNLDANETETQRFLLENLPVTPQWNYTNGLVYKNYREKGFTTIVLSRNMLNNQALKYRNNDETISDNKVLDYKSQEIENKLRIENTTRILNWKTNFGVNYEFAKYNNATFNRIFTSSGAQTINYATAFSMHKYGLFGQVSNNFLNEKLILSLGLRADGNSYSDEMINPFKQFSPRFSLAYAITNRLSFNFNSGIYYQLPPYTVLGYKAENVLVNKQNKISYIRNSHLVGGFEYNTASNSKITIEGYYKNYDNYPFLLRDSIALANLGGDFGVIGNEPATSTADGRTYGVEVLFQQRLYKGLYGIVAYTFGRSEFIDKKNNFVPSSWDSRHIVALTAGYTFKKNWELGVKWRFQSGLPFTPFSDNSSLVSSWNVNGRGIRDFNQLNSLRNENFSQFDIRLDKKWFFKKWSLNLYFDIQNAFINSVATQELILDRAVDANGTPIGGGVISNPDAPIEQQRYQLKTLDDAQGTLLPTLGIVIGI